MSPLRREFDPATGILSHARCFGLSSGKPETGLSPLNQKGQAGERGQFPPLVRTTAVNP